MRIAVLAAACAAALLTVSSAAAQSAQYGALAIDSNGGEGYGWAVNGSTQKEADWGALNKCGGGCHVVVRFYGGCAAYAVSDTDHSVFGWGKGANALVAKSRAMEEVRAHGGGKSATIRVWGCNGS